MHVCITIIVNIINKQDFESYPDKLYFYLIDHEIGHCIQNSKTIKRTVENYDDLKHIATIQHYYFPILIDEFKANRNIHELYKETDLFKEMEFLFIDDLVKISNNYYDNKKYTFESISLFWFLNVQYAKLAAILLDYPIDSFEEYFKKVNVNFKYKEILELYRHYIESVVDESELLNQLCLFQ
jgi:hypothetical protein